MNTKKFIEKHYSNIYSSKDALEDLISELEEKRDAIEEKALDHDRDMTEKEQERYDFIDEQIDNIQSCIDSLEDAISYLDEFF